jgi:hypothetical protein
MVLAVAYPSMDGTRAAFSENTRTVLRDAGLWLRDHGGEGHLMMGHSSVVAYYSRGTLAYLPWSAASNALQYLHTVSPDYVVLWSGAAERTPYGKDWLRDGIPDRCAALATRLGGAGEEQVAVFRWVCKE